MSEGQHTQEVPCLDWMQLNGGRGCEEHGTSPRRYFLKELHELVRIGFFIHFVGDSADFWYLPSARPMCLIRDDTEIVAAKEDIPDLLPPSGDEPLRDETEAARTRGESLNPP